MECLHFLFVKVCICFLLLLLFCVYIFTIQLLFISQLLDIQWVSNFITFTTIKVLYLWFGISYSISFCNLIFSYPNANNQFTPHNQHGFYSLKQVLHFAHLKQCALMIIIWVLLHGALRHCGFKELHMSASLMMESLIVQCRYHM